MGRRSVAAATVIAIALLAAAGTYLNYEGESDNQAPTCSIIPDKSAGYAPLEVTFEIWANDSDGTITSWQLEIVDNGEVVFQYGGQGDPPASLAHVFNASGLFTVSLIVQDNDYAVGSDSVNIFINSGSATDLRVYVIDVGQGDAILIQTPDTKNILIDAGDNAHAESLVQFLSSHSVSNIDVFVLTHPHADHIGGADEVLEAFTVLSIWHPGYYLDTVTYETFIDAAEAEGCPIYTDNDVDPGDLMDWWSDCVDFWILSINASAENPNDSSIVIKMTYGMVDFLFTGDIGFDVEDYLLVNYDLDIDILKVSHHGSAYATSAEFLAEMTPDIAVISVGEDNPYGHPSPYTIARLESAGVDIFRTDLNGTVTIVSDGTGWSVTVEFS